MSDNWLTGFAVLGATFGIIVLVALAAITGLLKEIRDALKDRRSS